MRQLIALAERVRPGIHEADDALQAVRRRPDQQHESDQQQHEQGGKQLPVHSSQEQNTHRDYRDDDECAEVGFSQQQSSDQQHHHQHRQKAFAETVHQRRLAHRVIGGVQRHEQFHQFRRLQIEHAQREPALAAVDLLADTGDQDHQQQQDTEHKKVGCGLLPYARRELEAYEAGHYADENEHALADEEVRRLVAGVSARLGNGDGRGIHHHQPDSE